MTLITRGMGGPLTLTRGLSSAPLINGDWEFGCFGLRWRFGCFAGRYDIGCADSRWRFGRLEL